MKAALLLLVLAPAAAAQVIECPKFYSWQDTQLARVPHQHNGKGFVLKAKLSGAGMYLGALNSEYELRGDRKKVKGGWDHDYDFGPNFAFPEEPKWLVCSYGTGGDIRWWEQVDIKATRCFLKLREGGREPMTATLTCSAGDRDR